MKKILLTLTILSIFINNFAVQLPPESPKSKKQLIALKKSALIKSDAIKAINFVIKTLSISDASLGEFIRQLKYKALWYYKEIKQIGRFEPSSKMCNNCCKINKNLQLSDRRWKCKFCLTMHDRDINAAKNILKIGQGMSESKSVEKSTAVFSFKRKQVDSTKQKPVSESS